MLTTELVRARRQGTELRVNPLAEDQRARALALAEVYVSTVRAFVGKTRDELDEALDEVAVGTRDRLVADGLRKLIEDRCTFDTEEGVDPALLRREVFLLAAAARRGAARPGGGAEEALAGGDHHLPHPDAAEDEAAAQSRAATLAAAAFDRDAVLTRVAAEQGLAVEVLERGLYADLRGAQVLTEVAPVVAAELVAGYDVAQAQAVLLRAVRVVAEVRCASAGAYRALFRKLKFLRLLVRIDPEGAAPRAGRSPGEASGYRLEIDGPYSLFDQVTKYGLQLALALPTLLSCDSCRLRAEVRWGKERAPLLFQLSGGMGQVAEAPAKRKGRGDEELEGPAPPERRPRAAATQAALPTLEAEVEHVPDEVAALVKGFQALESAFSVVLAPAVLHLPGVGVCVPDLLFRHRESGRVIYFEVLGYWSRDAVWRRVELVEAGLREPILFALSERLRVSEQALAGDLPAALYVYKGVIHPRAVLERLETLHRGLLERTRPGAKPA